MGNDLKIKTGLPMDLKILLLMSLIYHRASTENISNKQFLAGALIKIAKFKAVLKFNKLWWDSQQVKNLSLSWFLRR